MQALRDMTISIPEQQDFGRNLLTVCETDQYQKEYVQSFVAQWDKLIDWDMRAKSEGRFFVEILKAREKRKILDVVTGTVLHSVQLLKAGIDVTARMATPKCSPRHLKTAASAGSFCKLFMRTGVG